MKEYDYLEMQRKGRSLKNNIENLPEVKIAVLGDFATQQFVRILKTSVYNKGFFPVIYESDFNAIQNEIINPESGLYTFLPDYAYIAISMQGYRERFYNLNYESKESFPEEYVRELKELINILLEKRIQVIVNTLSLPFERIYGNYSIKTTHSLYKSVISVNNLLVNHIGDLPGCFFNDILAISSNIGLNNWYDEKLWNYSKYMCSPDHFPYITESFSQIIAATKGKMSKCIVLDLDETLWGGIIGDDGLEGIKIGNDREGEPYLRFQKYLLQLKDRGYILAVCSKNEYENAILPFREHPEMLIKEDDISVFIANWNNKPQNMEQISRVLNIGLDSLIYLDDSVFERNQMRAMLPQVITPDLPEDPADYIRAIEQEGIFETVSISKEDRHRSKMYKSEAQRNIESAKYKNIDDFLKSLEMKVQFKTFDNINLPRIVQLIQRTNQFNLRTQRYSENQIKDFMKNPQKYFPVYVKLQDKYGDYGLVSVLILEIKNDHMFISEFIMSCRVFKRGLENFIMNQIVLEAKGRKIKKIVGEYILTKKNSPVKDLYKNFNFKLIEENESSSIWELNTEKYKEQKCFMELNNE